MNKRAKLFLNTHRQQKLLNPSNKNYKRWLVQHTVGEFEKDLGAGDITSRACGFAPSKKISAFVIAKENGVLAGRQEITWFLKSFRSIKFLFLKKDGQRVAKGEKIILLKGPAADLMKTERIILNVIGRMSGVATQTKKFMEKAQKAAPGILITPTRKTLWGLLDKRACVLGGGGTHRLGLDNAILIKHNHIKASGKNIGDLLRDSVRYLQKAEKRRIRFIEVEVRNTACAMEAARIFANAEINGLRLPCFIMFDNMRPKEISRAVTQIKKTGFYNHILLEASGRISFNNIAAYAKTGVDILSIGAITHSAPMLDISMRVE